MNAPDRLAPLPDHARTEAQQRVVQAIVEGPRQAFGGPFLPMLRSPDLTDRLQRVGEYLRWGSHLPGNLRELAILTVVRRWNQPVEWAAHVEAGAAENLTVEQMRAIADGRRPEGTPVEQALYDFCIRLLDKHRVDEPSYRLLFDAIGEVAMVDLVGLCGYYVTMSMTLNVFQPDDEVGNRFLV